MQSLRIDLRGLSLSSSCVSFRPKGTYEHPAKYGNYCDAYTQVGKFRQGLRMANMWFENIKLLQNNGFTGIDGYYWQHEDAAWFVLKDETVDVKFTNPNLCFTGYLSPPSFMVREMYEISGGNPEELVKYTDPEKYYEKRGMKYKNGIVWTTAGLAFAEQQIAARKARLKGTKV